MMAEIGRHVFSVVRALNEAWCSLLGTQVCLSGEA